MPRKEIDLSSWQNYVSKESGYLLFSDTSSFATLPVRNQIDEEGNALHWEPDYATGTYGLRTCQMSKVINAVVKARHRYLFFATRYNGLDSSYKNRYLLFGYMKIEKVRDVRDRHIANSLRNPDLPTPECLSLKNSWALWAEEIKFCDLPDALELTPELMEKWGGTAKVTRQTKFVFEEEPLREVLAHFESVADLTDEYIGTVEEFVSAIQEEEE